jgi:hypothetical protein
MLFKDVTESRTVIIVCKVHGPYDMGSRETGAAKAYDRGGFNNLKG